MILPDTAIWTDHIHGKDKQLEFLLRGDRVLVHPFVIGEIALASMKRHDAIIEAMTILRAAPVATDEDVRFMIKQHTIMGTGLGYVDAHILASARLVPGSSIWTRDKRLKAVAQRMGVAWTT
jgi:predicted nucleic acid-binding protein